MINTNKFKRHWEQSNYAGPAVLGPKCGKSAWDCLYAHSGRKKYGCSVSGSCATNHYYVSYTATLRQRSAEIMGAL